MTGRRGLLLSLALCVAGGALVLLSSGRRWAEATVTAATGARQHVEVTGHAVAPALPALGVCVLVVGLAMLAVRGWARRAAGLLVVVLGGAAVAVAVTARSDVGDELARQAFGVQQVPAGIGANAWSWVAVAGGLLAVAGGALAVAAGRTWPGMGSRYDAPAARAQDPDGSAWAALDRGEDPTV